MTINNNKSTEEEERRQPRERVQETARWWRRCRGGRSASTARARNRLAAHSRTSNWWAATAPEGYKGSVTTLRSVGVTRFVLLAMRVRMKVC